MSHRGEGVRRAEILDQAAELFGSSGFHVTLKEISDACGILPGSLYHHFDSKEAIILELIVRYQSELDEIARNALADLRSGEPNAVFDRVVALAESILQCAFSHRAALLQTIYDPPANASADFKSLARRTPRAIDSAMEEILRAGRAEGYIGREIELGRLAEQICQSMLHTGVGFFHRTPGARRLPALKCRALLEGLAARVPNDAALERSNAFRAAQETIASWQYQQEDRALAQLCSVARSEFGRRGYEATTIRDIATAAGMSTGAVYRLVGSKEELLQSVMAPYVEQTMRSWDALMQSKSSAVEKLDALLWVNINILDQFSDEQRIQLAWLRESPPLSWSNISQFKQRLQQMQRLLAEGRRSGQLRLEGASVNVWAHCLLELTWTPESIIHSAGTRAALAQARATLLRGAAAGR